MALIIDENKLKVTLDLIGGGTFPNIPAAQVYNVINMLKSLPKLEKEEKAKDKKSAKVDKKSA